MRKIFAIGILIAALAIALPALAAENPSLKQAMTKFGLIGEWAAQCSQPPSKDNARTHWSARSETKGELLTDFGDGHTMTYDINSGELVGADRIRLRLVNNQQSTPLELIIEKRNGHVRTLSSLRGDGSALIKDGKFVSSGADTVAQERCN
jgi:hypothetical protein